MKRQLSILIAVAAICAGPGGAIAQPAFTTTDRGEGILPGSI